MPRAKRPAALSQEAIRRGTCGACLMELIDESETVLLDEKLDLCVEKPALCNHLFHRNCLMHWFERDTSCPQCRIRVDQVLVFRSDNGQYVRSKNVDQVFLEDVLDKEEEAEDGEETDERDDSLQTASFLPATVVEESAREMRRKTDERVLVKIKAETERMRARLAAERARELREQKAILNKVDPLKVRLAIVRNLRRLPYHLQLNGDSAVVVPTVKRVRTARQAPPSFISLSAPSYETDFLAGSREKG